MANRWGYAECPQCTKFLVYGPGCLQCGHGIVRPSLEEQAASSAEFWKKYEEEQRLKFPEEGEVVPVTAGAGIPADQTDDAS